MVSNEELLGLYGHVRRKISVLAASLLKDSGLGTRQFIILRALSIETELTMTDLAERCMTDLATISRSLIQLQRTGLVEKKQSSADGRVWIARLTKKGLAEITSINEIYSELSRQCFSKLKPKEKKELAHLLTLIINQITSF